MKTLTRENLTEKELKRLNKFLDGVGYPQGRMRGIELGYLQGYTDAMELMTEQIATQLEQAATELRAIKKL